MTSRIATALMAVAGLLLLGLPSAHADTVTATVPVGGAPWGVAITPDSAHVYVANNTSDSVSVIDTATNTVTTTIAVGEGPGGVAITPDGTRAYIANLSGRSVSVIDTATNTVTTTIAVDAKPGTVAITPDGAHAYVTDSGVSSVLVIDTATNTVTATIEVGSYRGVAITPDGRNAYVTSTFGSSMSVIDTATNTVTTTIGVDNPPIAVAVTPDGAHAYLVSRSAGSVSVVDTATNTVTTTIEVDAQPNSVAISPDGDRAYIPHFENSNKVSVIDTATNTVSETIDVGAYPIDVAIAPDGAHAYVTNTAGRNVSVIAIGKDAPTLTGTPPAGVVDAPYSHAFTVAGAPAPLVAVTAGALPAGLHLSDAGVLSGTPSAAGVSSFTVSASNGVGTPATLEVTFTVAQAPAAPAFLDAGPIVLNGIADAAFTHTFAVAGHPDPTVTVTSGTLPAGLHLSDAGVLSGTPSAAGTSEFTVTASNGVGSPATLHVAVTVAAAPAPPVFTDAAPVTLNAVTGTALSRKFTAIGNPAPAISVLDESKLPPGMLFVDGTLTGTPTVAGTHTFTLTASNGVGPDLTLEVTMIVTAASVTPEPPATGSLSSFGSLGALFGS